MEVERRTWEPDPNYDPGGILRVHHKPGDREVRGPFFLAGVLGGEVRITNLVPPTAIKLYRFATLRQAQAAVPAVMAAARSYDGGDQWLVPEVSLHRPLGDVGTQVHLMREWMRRLEPELQRRLAPFGPGHYSLVHLIPKQRRRIHR